MKKIAIVGNIACGKSLAEKFLSEHGYFVADSDKIAHEILLTEGKIKQEFKNYDVFENGEISRNKLGKIIFADKDLKAKLENIMHPVIRSRIEDIFDKNKNEKYIFVSVPLLFEAGMQGMFDKIIFIYADDGIRLKRLVERNGYSVDYALNRMNCQQSQDEKIQMADYVIYNNSSVENLEQQLFKIIE